MYRLRSPGHSENILQIIETKRYLYSSMHHVTHTPPRDKCCSIEKKVQSDRTTHDITACILSGRLLVPRVLPVR